MIPTGPFPGLEGDRDALFGPLLDEFEQVLFRAGAQTLISVGAVLPHRAQDLYYAVGIFIQFADSADHQTSQAAMHEAAALAVW